MSEEELFEAALEKPTFEEREAFLDEACGGDLQLRERLARLIAADARALGMLDSNAGVVQAAGANRRIDESPGSIIGIYRLLEQIGEGGFGLVFVAEQQAPLKRRVALKIIKPGMDTREVIARFEAERQALALMDHPNIAKVFAAEATDSGRPYFVMELVRGIPITQYCDDNLLTPRERLELFVTVCQAIQHAHQKGIIHRDIKPSNVLVTSHDDKPVAKIIDFGVAKALHQNLTERTVYTQFTQMIGTPLYMSPEQAQMSGLDIDTRSDIYSLGVLLYELLTGTTPLERKLLTAAAYDEIRRLIREEEPPKPSTRLSSSESAAAVAAQRKMEPAKLSQLVRGDLDWITMKCLEKDRARRYETANGVVRDIERYLNVEPVEACPPSALYRVRKFLRRHKGPAVASALVLVALLAGIIGTTWGLLRAEHNRQKAEDKEKEALAEKAIAIAERDAKGRALTAETRARAAEKLARNQALAALRGMTDEVIENQVARGASLNDESRDFIRKIITLFEGLAAITADDAESRAIRAEGCFGVGRMRFRLGEAKEAEKAYQAALEIWERLVADFPTRADFRQELALCQTNLGTLFASTGRPREAEDAYNRSLAQQRQLVAESPAQREFRRQLASVQNNAAILFQNTGRPEDAESAFCAALAIANELVAEDPARAEYRVELAKDHSNLGVLFRATGRLQEAKNEHASALIVQKQLVADFPDRPDYRHDLGRYYNNLANVLMTLDRSKDAETAFADALLNYKQLAAEFPTRPEFRQDLAMSLNNLGNLLRQLGRMSEAEDAHIEALAIRKRLAADFPSRPAFRQDLAFNHNSLGLLFKATGRLKEAEAAYAEALAVRRQLVEEYPEQPDMRNELAGTLVNLANLCNQRRDFRQARAYLEKAEPHHHAALKTNPRHPFYRQYYRTYLLALARAHAGLGDSAGAFRAAETVRDLGWDPPINAFDAAVVLAQCVAVVSQDPELDGADRRVAAQAYGDRAMTMLQEALTKGFKDAARIKDDANLAPLRERLDFKKVLADLEAAGKPLAKP